MADLNVLLRQQEKEIILVDRILKHIKENYANEYPQFKSENGLYEIKESLSFLDRFDLNKDTNRITKILTTISQYFNNLKIISDKKRRKKTYNDYARKKIEKAIDTLQDIQEYLYGFQELDEDERYNIIGREKDVSDSIDNLVDELHYELFLIRDMSVNPTKANKAFDIGFNTALKGTNEYSRLSPLELGKRVAEIRITIRRIFNNKLEYTTKK
ncbi:hypothetical protein [Campylobacter sp.]|uniref:hypothetical protein n=1 Tax=Campylobacter sp. TaxID=205 RepID=UPI0026FD1630|nr:hypothetical protein [Campylobacter sp.]